MTLTLGNSRRKMNSSIPYEPTPTLSCDSRVVPIARRQKRCLAAAQKEVDLHGAKDYTDLHCCFLMKVFYDFIRCS